MDFQASLDKLAKGVTIGVFIIFLIISQQSVREIISANGDQNTILTHAGIIVFFIIIILISWLYAPRSYTLNDLYLIINRPIGQVKIPLANITQVRQLADNETNRTIRTFGVGGLFGYFGKFYTPGLGHSTYYATRLKNMILVVTNNDKKIIITPDDLSLVEKINSAKTIREEK